jgi:GH24 family phage-related lysozyme (muramidase)
VLVAYSDGHHFSIGFGHNDPALTAASTITAEDAWALFAKDLIPREDAVNAMLKIPVEQHQFDACVSLYYQGGNKLRVVADLINAGNIPEAMAMQLSFNRDYTHSEFHLGLAKRRLAEVTMFMTADYGDLSKMKLFAADPRTTPFTEVPFPPET